MKIFLKHPSGWEFHFSRQPLEKDKFYALVALAVVALFVALVLGAVALRR